MGTVNVYRRLRPLRLAFLVRPEDSESLRRIFETNTCLWGGQFNGIIPVYAQKPTWWESTLEQSWSASDVVKGYLTAFEPDFVVTTGHGLENDLGWDKKRLISFDEVMATEEGDEHIGRGLSVINCYRGLYEQVHQFVTRHPYKVVLPNPAVPELSLFSAMCFGAFPHAAALAYFGQAYQEAFESQNLTLDGSTLFDFYEPSTRTPLQIGSTSLAVQRWGKAQSPTLFYMDGTSTHDLIEFWNMRALGCRIRPVPKQWADMLIEPCKRFVSDNNIPLHSKSQLKQSTTVMRSCTTHDNETKDFTRLINTDIDGAVVLQLWGYQLWNNWDRKVDNIQRCTVSADQNDSEHCVENSQISFPLEAPNFGDKDGLMGRAQWVNVIQIRDFNPGSELAHVFPSDIREVARLLHEFPRDSIYISPEGIVVLCEGRRGRMCRWTLPNSFEVVRLWSSTRALTIELSGAGRVVKQLIRHLGGPLGAKWVAHKSILELLEKMTYGLVETSPDEHSKPRARARMESRGRLLGELQQVNEGDKDRAERHFNILIE